jgi:hypothetical protein
MDCVLKQYFFFFFLIPSLSPSITKPELISFYLLTKRKKNKKREVKAKKTPKIDGVFEVAMKRSI